MFDTSGGEWIGERFADLPTSVRTQTEGSYGTERIVQPARRCGGAVFEIWADAAEGCARRICVSCGKVAAISDSEGYWQEAEPGSARGHCGEAHYEVGVGYAFRASSPREVKWIASGVRCIRCEAVGRPAARMIDDAPADHLPASA